VAYEAGRYHGKARLGEGRRSQASYSFTLDVYGWPVIDCFFIMNTLWSRNFSLNIGCAVSNRGEDSQLFVQSAADAQTSATEMQRVHTQKRPLFPQLRNSQQSQMLPFSRGKGRESVVVGGELEQVNDSQKIHNIYV